MNTNQSMIRIYEYLRMGDTLRSLPPHQTVVWCGGGQGHSARLALASRRSCGSRAKRVRQAGLPPCGAALNLYGSIYEPSLISRTPLFSLRIIFLTSGRRYHTSMSFFHFSASSTIRAASAERSANLPLRSNFLSEESFGIYSMSARMRGK